MIVREKIMLTIHFGCGYLSEHRVVWIEAGLERGQVGGY